MIFTMLLHLLRLPKTPAVRNPRHKERVYSISVNGSPIAAGNEDIIINVPIGNGEVSAQLAGLRLVDPIEQFFIQVSHCFYQQCQHLKVLEVFFICNLCVRSVFVFASDYFVHLFNDNWQHFGVGWCIYLMSCNVLIQSVQLLASQMDSVDLSSLDETALRSIRLLQVYRSLV